MLLESYNLPSEIKTISSMKNITMNFALYSDMLSERIYHPIHYWIKGFFFLVFWYCIVYLHHSYGKYSNENRTLMLKYIYFYEQGNHERCIDILQRKCKIRRQCNSVFKWLGIMKLLLILAITWGGLKSLVCKIFKKEKTQTKRGVKFDSVSNRHVTPPPPNITS